MDVFVVLSIFLATLIGIGSGTDGPEAEIGEFPWQVGILAQKTKQFCGGSLFDREWVMTAAHCVDGETLAVLRFGAVTLRPKEKGSRIMVSTHFIAHEDYNDELNNDIALIKLPAPIKLTDKIRTIRLPKLGEKISPGAEVIISGWGSSCGQVLVNSTLTWINMNTIPNEECVRIYGPLVVRRNTFCALSDNSPGVCTGDSGGPSVTMDESGEPVLHGIVSFGSANLTAVDHPSGFLRVESLLNWIAEKTGLDIL